MSKDFKKNILFLCIFLGISCVVSYIFAHWPDFDFFAYHFNNGWAFLHNRIDIDFLPCFFRSYFNPILDSLIYISMILFNNHPILFILFSGLKYGIFLFLTYKIAELAFPEKNNALSVLFCVILTALSPILVFCINFDNTDMQVAVLILIGIYLYLKNVFNSDSKHRMTILLIAGALMGLAVGLKYTCISSPAAILLISLCLHKRIIEPKKVFITLLKGMFYGFLITGFPWMALLYYKFQNPMYPYFNNIFMSPLADNDNMLSADFSHIHPKNIIEFITYPMKNTLSAHNISLEKAYFDLKNYLGFIGCILAFFVTRTGNIEKKYSKSVDFNLLYFSLLFIAFTYYINLLIFANYRYILTILVFIPIIVCYIIKIICKKQFYAYSLISICALSFCTYANIDKLVNWREVAPQKVVNIEKIDLGEKATVICANFMGCFFAPAQNKDIKYIGFSLHPDFLEQSIWAEAEYKNFTYQNEYLRRVLRQTLTKEKNVYFAYPVEEFILGEKQKELKIYEESLSKYMGKKVKLNNCESVHYTVMKNNYPNEVKICKLRK